MMNKKLTVILIIFAVYLFTIAVIAVVAIAGKKEARPALILHPVKTEKAAGRALKHKEAAPAKAAEAPSPVDEEIESEPPVKGPLLQ